MRGILAESVGGMFEAAEGQSTFWESFPADPLPHLALTGRGGQRGLHRFKLRDSSSPCTQPQPKDFLVSL